MKNQLRGGWTSASNALADRLCRGRYQAQRNLPELPSSGKSQASLVTLNGFVLVPLTKVHECGDIFDLRTLWR
jgi:hypothetical protein